MSSPSSWPGWLYAKFVLWLLVGALPVFIKKGIVPRTAGWVVVVLLAGGAAWLALAKPF